MNLNERKPLERRERESADLSAGIIGVHQFFPASLNRAWVPGL
jgi:hypothetical protein